MNSTIAENRDAKKDFRLDINALRAIAVLMVLLFHFSVPFVGGGYAGVDVFFVISGYLMTRIIFGAQANGTFSLVGYYKARVARIVPALVVMVAVTLAWGWLFVDPLAYKDMALQAASAVVFLSNILFFFTSGYFGPTAEDVWFLHTWSLSVEWQFYLIYPLVVLLLVRLFPRLHRTIFAVSLVLLCAGTIALSLSGSAKVTSFLFYMFPTRAWEMLLGGCLYLFPLALPIAARRALEAIGVLLLVVTLFIFTKNTPWPGVYTLLPALAAAMIISANCGPATMLGNPVAQRIGAWSYSIYLAHWPILVALRYTGHDTAIGLALGFAASILLGFLSHRFVEEPGRKLINAVHFRSPRLAAAWAVFLLAAFLPYGIYRQDGFLSRSPANAREIIADAIVAKDDWTFPASCEGYDAQGKLRLCSLGSATENRTLVIGDSYAQMWFPRATSIASSRNLSVDFATMTGCPPMLGLALTTNPKCTTFNSLAEALAQAPKYKRIAIIGSWNNYLDYQNPDKTSCIPTASGCQKVNSKQTALVAIEHLKQFVGKMEGLGKEVAVGLPSPDIGSTGPDNLASDVFNNRGLQAYRDISRTPPANIRSLFDTFRQESANTIIADLSDGWCNGDRCSVLDARNHTILKDNGHFRASYVSGLPGLDRILFDTK